VLCGVGTAGAYQAGALRALAEAGIKVDVVAAHGAGVLTALAAAIDGGSRLWAADGPWSDRRLRRAYRWRPALRVAMAGLLAALVVLASPLLVLVLAGAVYALSLLAALVNLDSGAAALVSWYDRAIESLFSPPLLPTMVPRAVVLLLLLTAAVLVVSALHALRTERSRRRILGLFWWRLLGSPLDAAEPRGTLVEALWRLVRGASDGPTPDAADIGRRYVDVLADNVGQPGFHEVLVAIHDLDARRDLVGAVLAGPARAPFEARSRGGPPRAAEIVDFTGPQRDLIADFLAGALCLPIANEPHVLRFPAASYWRGERHRVCDRPEVVARLIDELATVGVEQVILVSPAPPATMPHSLGARPIDLRARIGEIVRSIETAALQDACAAAATRFSGVFVVQPAHNPIGPFDFAGLYDDASDRRRSLEDLMEQGYADAYRLFIEPVVAAGEVPDEDA
jgi:hypothetical protein